MKKNIIFAFCLLIIVALAGYLIFQEKNTSQKTINTQREQLKKIYEQIIKAQEKQFKDLEINYKQLSDNHTILLEDIRLNKTITESQLLNIASKNTKVLIEHFKLYDSFFEESFELINWYATEIDPYIEKYRTHVSISAKGIMMLPFAGPTVDFFMDGFRAVLSTSKTISEFSTSIDKTTKSMEQIVGLANKYETTREGSILFQISDILNKKFRKQLHASKDYMAELQDLLNSTIDILNDFNEFQRDFKGYVNSNISKLKSFFTDTNNNQAVEVEQGIIDIKINQLQEKVLRLNKEIVKYNNLIDEDFKIISNISSSLNIVKNYIYNNENKRKELIDANINKEEMISTNKNDQDNIPAKHELFFKTFMSDSNFQKTHIKFPYPVIIIDFDGEDETESTEAEYEYFTFLDGDYSYTLDITDNSGFIVTANLVETGFAVSYYFSKLEGQWYLIKKKYMSF